MASKNIPLPPALRMQSSEVAVNWKRFRSQWSNYELATDLSGESKEKRTAILLSCIGSEAYDVFQSMVFEDESHRSDIDHVIRAFDDYCIGETNVTYERYVLNKRVQENNESFDAFMTEIRRLVRSCDYGQLEDSVVKDKIVIGIRDDSTRRKLLQIRKLDLAAAIDVCRASESATRQLKEFKGSEEISRIAPKTRGRERQRWKSGDRRQTIRREDPNSGKNFRKCRFCGKAHGFKKELCPAFGKDCKICSKKNHFAAMCKNRNTPDRSRRSCHLVDSESEDIFAVETGKFKRKLFASLELNNSRIKFQLDCGATVNVLPESLTK